MLLLNLRFVGLLFDFDDQEMFTCYDVDAFSR